MTDDAITNQIIVESHVKKENLVILTSCLGLGVLFDYMFFGQGLGINYPVFVLAFYVVFGFNTRKRLKPGLMMGWFLILPVFLLSITYSIFQNMVFQVLNFVLVPVLVLVQTLLVTESSVHQWDCFQFIVDMIYGVFVRPLAYISKPLRVIADYFPRKGTPGKSSTAKKILTGIAVSIPLVIIILVLLSSADLVFSSLLSRITDIFSPNFLEDAITHLILIFFVLFTVFSYLWSILRSEKKPPLISSDVKIITGYPDPVIVQTVLTLLNLIYLMFVFIQFTYFFSSLNASLPAGLTYADYARRGFFELVAVTFINLCVLAGSIVLSKRTSGRQILTTRALQSLLVCCTFIILISAFFRMLLYEETYGYTYLRVFTHYFMVFLFIILITTVLGVWKGSFRLLKPYIIIALVFYVGLNFMNVDKMIASNNIDRYVKTGDIDTEYLTSLSEDSIPKLTRFLSANPDKPELNAMREYLMQKRKELLNQASWQMFNFSRYNAEQALSKYK